MLRYHSIERLASESMGRSQSISQMVLADQARHSDCAEEEVYDQMLGNLRVMIESARKGREPGILSTSGLTGGGGSLLERYADSGKTLSGDLAARALAIATGIAEYNAAMGRIVAAPTAGSCGILPGAVVAMMEVRGVEERPAVMSLFTAGAIGLVIAAEASISGAEGGCQAECGSAAGMAAAALVELAGGTPRMAVHACAIALKNQLGLVCDPVGGLVEIPCVKRNAGGVATAFAAADMALAGVESYIPVDEVVQAMREVGDALPKSLRETALGGLAATPTGLQIKEKVLGGASGAIS